jgi:hypothetical protein
MTVNCDAARVGGTKFDIQQLTKSGKRVEEIDSRLVWFASKALQGVTERVNYEQELQVRMIM